jgi:hypothetical protein
VPSRIIREGILTSDRVDLLDAASEVFYRRLMSKVDDHGLYDARPKILRASLYPLRIERVREADISRWIAECEKAGLIALYQHDGKPYMLMVDTRWTARSEPKYPIPPENIREQVKTPVPVVVVEDEVDNEDVVGKARKRALACPDGVSALVWGDWQALRRAKKAPVTATVLAEAEREAAKAGMSLEAFLSEWCSRGSQGLKAEWLKPNGNTGAKAPQSFRERDAATAAARVHEMSGGLLGKPLEEKNDALPLAVRVG